MRNLILAATAILAFSASDAIAAGPKGCPPGLAKKGCVPPGQAKKNYTLGQPLADDIRYAPVDWRGRYPQPRPGTTYAQVDGDILLIAEGARRVIELIAIGDALTN